MNVDESGRPAREVFSPGTAVVVSGGTGFLGSRVVRELLDRGCAVTSIDNSSTDHAVVDERLIHPAHKVASVDIRDREATVTALVEAQPSVVIHLAALHFIPRCVAEPATALEINVVGTQNLLDACRLLSRGPKFVLASTADVYLPSEEPHTEGSEIGPNNVYGLSKLAAEGIVRIAAQQGTCAPVICRLFNLYGAHETNPHVIPEIVSQLRLSDELHLGNTSPMRDFVYVDDAATAILRLCEVAPPGMTVNVGTGVSYSVVEVVGRISDLLGRSLAIVVDQARWRQSDRPHLRADPALLQSLVPGALSTPLSQGLEQLLRDERLL